MANKPEKRVDSTVENAPLSADSIREPLEDTSNEKKIIEQGKNNIGELVQELKLPLEDGENAGKNSSDNEKKNIDPKLLKILSNITDDEQYQLRILEAIRNKMSKNSPFCTPYEFLQKIISLPADFYKDERDITIPFGFFEGSPLEFFEKATIKVAQELLNEFGDTLLAMKAYFDCKGQVKKILKYRTITLSNGSKYDSEDIQTFLDNMISPRVIKKYIKEGIENTEEIINFVNRRIKPKKAGKLKEGRAI